MPDPMAVSPLCNSTIPGNVSAQNVYFNQGTTTIGGSLTASDMVYVNSGIAVTVAGRTGGRDIVV